MYSNTFDWWTIMARGRKKQVDLTLEEQLEAVNKQIQEYENDLKDLKRKKKELSNQIEDDKKEKMYRAVVESGKTIEEVLAVLDEGKKEENQ